LEQPKYLEATLTNQNYNNQENSRRLISVNVRCFFEMLKITKNFFFQCHHMSSQASCPFPLPGRILTKNLSRQAAADLSLWPRSPRKRMEKTYYQYLCFDIKSGLRCVGTNTP